MKLAELVFWTLITIVCILLIFAMGVVLGKGVEYTHPCTHLAEYRDMDEYPEDYCETWREMDRAEKRRQK